MCRIVIVAFVGGILLEVFTVRDRRFQRFPVSQLYNIRVWEALQWILFWKLMCL